jgi:sulfhydrogenase subunit beta (sulfur reductase)
MSLQIVPKTALSAWIEKMCMDYRVVGPKPLHGQHVFGEVRSMAEVDLDYATTVVPPKKYLFPQAEALFTFKTDGSHLTPMVQAEPTVVLGVHTCDLHAMHLLDRVSASSVWFRVWTTPFARAWEPFPPPRASTCT